MASKPEAVRVRVLNGPPETVWAETPEKRRAFTVRLAVSALVVMATLASTVSVAPAELMFVALVAL